MRNLAISVFVTLVFLVSGRVAFGQELPSLGGVAINVELADPDVQVGDIISITKEGLKRTTAAYDIQMYGVIAATPVLSVAPKTDKTRALVSSGVTDVKVSAQAGAIEVGDYLTSSETAGVGQKATASGYVLGKALAKYDDSSKTGLIPTEVNIGFVEVEGVTRGGLIKVIATAFKNPEIFRNFMRYVLALIIGVLTFVGATFAFIRFMSSGLVALGRNPLAKRTIIAGMIMSGLVVVVLAAAGFGVAVAIIGVGNIWPR